MILNCDYCNKEIKIYPSSVKYKHHYCDMKCRGKWMSENLRGSNCSLWKGGSVCMKCEKCGNKFYINKSASINRRFCSMKCYNKSGKNTKGRIWSDESRRKLSESMTGHNNPMWMKIGELNPAWKGGVAKHNQMERLSKEIKQWKRKIYKRDKYTCQKCDIRGGKLNAHHIKSFAEYPELRLDLENGITLCEECHKNIHKCRKINETIR